MWPWKPRRSFQRGRTSNDLPTIQLLAAPELPILPDAHAESPRRLPYRPARLSALEHRGEHHHGGSIVRK
jgi:hypothetical protein